MQTETVPYPYQRHGIRLIEKANGRVIVGDEMGLGKTPQTLWWIDKYLEPGPVIFVVPANIKDNWRKEAKKHTGLRVQILSGRKPPRAGGGGMVAGKCRAYVINYDILGDPVKKRGTWLRTLKRLKPVCVVFDEAQYLKNPNTKRSKAAKELVRGVPHVLALSGTPITNRPAELFPLLNLTRPDLYPNFWPFAWRFCSPKRTRWGWDFSGASHLDELHAELRESGVLIRRLKKDVLKDLPPKTRSVVPMSLSTADRKEYDEAEKDFLRWLAKQSKSKAMRAAKSEKMVKVGYLIRLAGRLKMQAAVDWIHNFFEASAGKLIVFVSHHAAVDELRRRFPGCVTITGKTPEAKRRMAEDKFNRDPKCRLFVGNRQAAGVGWSCTSASTVAFLELGWTPGEHTQAEDRIHGVGRGDGTKAMIYYLVAEGTCEEKLAKVIQAKQRVLDEALDGKAGSGKLDVYDQLELMLKRRMI